MTTHEQDHMIEHLSLGHRGAPLKVEEGLEDGAVLVTANSRQAYIVDRFGGATLHRQVKCEGLDA